MNKNLMIIESPNKIKTISQYVKDQNIDLIATYGHLRDLSSYGMGFDKQLNPNWVVVSKLKKKNVARKTVNYDQIISRLIKAAKSADKIYLSTDPDREGEAIAWHVWSLLDLTSQKKCQRVVFHEITKPAILNALKNPRTINHNQVNSYLARRLLDREFGFKLSSFVQTYFQGISAGRVQSVALRFLVDREKEINNFIPQSWYTIEAWILGKKMKLTLKKLGPNFSHLLLNKELKDNKINFVDLENVSLAIKLLAKNFLLTTIHPDKLERYHPRPPLKTSTLQQEAINNFKISSRMVEQIAQKLYEGVEIFGQMESLITYPRTDQTVMSEVFIATAQKYLTKTYGKEYVALAVPLQATKTNEAKKQQLIQGAHEAIRPTNLNLTPQIVKPFLDQRAYQIYSLIWVRSLGWLMNPSIYCYKYFDFVNNSCLFQSYTRTRNFAGFELIYNQYGFKDNDSNQEVDFSLVKKLVVNQQYLADEINGVKHNKKPPSRYNEASLIQALEKNGIGRPSTYAAITATVLARDYATKVKGSLIPNEKGIKIIDGLSRLFQEIVSFDYTRKMEENLDAIANEEINWKEDFLKPTFAKFNQQLNKAKENQPKPAPVILDRKCPKCDQNLIHRMGVGKRGKFNFIGCSNYPNCNYLEQIKNQVNKIPSSKLDFNCPRCGKQLLKKKSRYNTFFVGCCDYPKCTYAMDYKKFCLQHHLEIKKEEEENE